MTRSTYSSTCGGTTAGGDPIRGLFGGLLGIPEADVPAMEVLCEWVGGYYACLPAAVEVQIR